MATVYSHDGTFADTIARIKSSRLLSKARSIIAKLPFNDTDGGVSSGAHEITADDATANSAAIQTGLKNIESFQVTHLDAAGVVQLNAATTVTASGGVITVAHATLIVATDVLQWSAKGK